MAGSNRTGLQSLPKHSSEAVASNAENPGDLFLGALFDVIVRKRRFSHVQGQWR